MTSKLVLMQPVAILLSRYKDTGSWKAPEIVRQHT